MRRHYGLIGSILACWMLLHSTLSSSALAQPPAPGSVQVPQDSIVQLADKQLGENQSTEKPLVQKPLVENQSTEKPLVESPTAENTAVDIKQKAGAKDATTSDLNCDSMGDKPKTLAESLENLGRLYKNDDHPVMQEWWFLGRYHGQYYHADSDSANQDDWEHRRFRIGSQALFFEKMTLHAQMVSGFDMDPFYNGFTELWSQWAFDERFAVTVGQQKHRFTHDRNVSSRYLNTLERSLLVNMFNADYTPAVTASGRSDKFAYYTGVFSNATGPDMWDAFTDYDSGYSLLASGTWNVDDQIDLDEAFFNVCYVYSDANQNATNLNQYRDGLSAALILTEGPNSLVSEAVMGTRGANGSAFGINIQPGHFLTEKLQLATRYQFTMADEENGLRAQRRYERNVGVTSGELYQAGYAGFNYYIAGHRIKLTNGIEYANMDGQDVWTASIALRIFWGPNSNGPFPMAKTLSPR